MAFVRGSGGVGGRGIMDCCYEIGVVGKGLSLL